MKKIAFLLTILLFAGGQAYAQDPRLNDTLWYSKVGQIIYMLKFSPDDRVIAAHCGFQTLFYETETGNYINKIESGAFSEIHYFDGGNRLVMVNPLKPTRLEIYDTHNYQLIDTMMNDSEAIGTLFVSKDQRFLVGTLKKGLRIWDLQSKEILRSKIYNFTETDLNDFNLRRAEISCDNSKIVSYFEKYYKINGQDDVRLEFAAFDFNSFEFIESKAIPRALFKISPACRYIAWGVSSDLGVEIYDFNTNQLLRKLPVYGYTLTGIEFTANEKYLVTSQTVGDNALTVWNVETGLKEYEYLPASYDCFITSHNGKYLAGGLKGIVLFKLDIHTDILPTNNAIVEVFPNPAFDNVNVEMDKEYLNIKWVITDLTGAAVLSGVQPSGSFIINTAILPSATYNLTLTIDGKSTSYPLIIAR